MFPFLGNSVRAVPESVHLATDFVTPAVFKLQAVTILGKLESVFPSVAERAFVTTEVNSSGVNHTNHHRMNFAGLFRTTSASASFKGTTDLMTPSHGAIFKNLLIAAALLVETT